MPMYFILFGVIASSPFEKLHWESNAGDVTKGHTNIRLDTTIPSQVLIVYHGHVQVESSLFCHIPAKGFKHRAKYQLWHVTFKTWKSKCCIIAKLTSC